MKEIQILYNLHIVTAFPDMRGEEINGIDLVMVDSYSAGLIQKFFANQGWLSREDFKILKNCHSNLKNIVKELENNNSLYFSNLLNIVDQMIALIKN